MLPAAKRISSVIDVLPFKTMLKNRLFIFRHKHPDNRSLCIDVNGRAIDSSQVYTRTSFSILQLNLLNEIILLCAKFCITFIPRLQIQDVYEIHRIHFSKSIIPQPFFPRADKLSSFYTQKLQETINFANKLILPRAFQFINANLNLKLTKLVARLWFGLFITLFAKSRRFRTIIAVKLRVAFLICDERCLRRQNSHKISLC